MKGEVLENPRWYIVIPFPTSQPFEADWNHENPQRFFSRFCQGWNHQGVLSDFQGWVSCGQDSMIQIPNLLWTQANQIFFSSHADAVPLTAVTGLQRCRYGIEVVGAIFLAHFLRLNTSLTTFNFRRRWEGGISSTALRTMAGPLEIFYRTEIWFR